MLPVVRAANAWSVNLERAAGWPTLTGTAGSDQGGIDVLDANSDRAPLTQQPIDLGRAHFPHRHRFVSHIQLHAMVTDAQTYAKSEERALEKIHPTGEPKSGGMLRTVAARALGFGVHWPPAELGKPARCK
jgi:hypothetical protein